MCLLPPPRPDRQQGVETLTVIDHYLHGVKRMTTRILGLIGSGQGPMIDTRALGQHPAAKVAGLKKGPVTVEVHDEDGVAHFMINCDGVLPLCKAARMRVSAPEGNFGMICTLHAKAS